MFRLSRAAAVAAVAMAAAVIVVPTASSVGVTEAFKYGFDAYSKYKTCVSNIDAGQPCLAGDSANIRQILKDVKALRAEIQRNQQAVQAQIALLQGTLDKKVRDDLVQQLDPISNNVVQALGRYEGLSTCASAGAEGKATCTGPKGATKPVPVALDAWQTALAYYVDLMPDDIRSAVKVFTGSDREGADSGLVAKDWLMHKRVQDQQTGVKDARILAALKTPVITAGLANSATLFATTYADDLKAYGLLKPFVVGLAQKPVVAHEMQQSVLDTVYGGDAYSVTSRVAQFSVPHLEAHEVGFVSKTDGRARVVSVGHRFAGAAGGKSLHPADVFDMAKAINAYSSVSAFRAGRPSAVPQDGWYYVTAHGGAVTHCPRLAAFCWRSLDAYAVHVHQLDARVSSTIVARMRLTDGRPGWNSAWKKTARGTGGLNFEDGFNANVVGDATFDWEEVFLEGRLSGYVGPGLWTKPVGATQASTARNLPSVPPMMGWPS